jgi:hypothetical protein
MKTVYTEWEEQSTRSAQAGYAEQAILLKRSRSNPEIRVDRHQYICYKVSDLQGKERSSSETGETPGSP